MGLPLFSPEKVCGRLPLINYNKTLDNRNKCGGKSMLIKQGMVIHPMNKTIEKKDLRIENGVITEIGDCLEEQLGEQIIDANGLYVAPGFVDVHVHFRDPGLTYKEDIHTGAKAAAKGGYTTVVMMANTKPTVDNVETLSYVLEEGRKTKIHVLSAAAITMGLKGENIAPMEELKRAGAVGFTDDGIPLMDEKLVKKAMEEAKRLDLPVSFHEENANFIENSGVNAGRIAEQMGLKGASHLAEDTLVARDGLLALETGCKVNIQHISSKNSVKLVRLYKEMGAPIYAEVTPHHFSMTEDDVLEHGTLAKMNPPLRTKEDQEELIRGLKDGTIDMIATDHAPHSAEEKNREFTSAPSGIIGLETAFSLAITNLVRKGHLTLPELMEKMSYNPAKLYQLDAGVIEIGKPADLVVFSEEETWKVESFVSKSCNSPFVGQTLYGRVHYTICNGEIAYQLEK